MCCSESAGKYGNLFSTFRKGKITYSAGEVKVRRLGRGRAVFSKYGKNVEY
jgi:hypothetical protein